MMEALTNFHQVLHPAERLSPGEKPTMVPCVSEYVQRMASIPSESGRKLTMRDQRELETTGLVLDALIQGKVSEAGDICVQRLKAVELANQSGTWTVAEELELIPRRTGATSQSELDVAGRQAVRRQSVENATKAKKDWHKR